MTPEQKQMLLEMHGIILNPSFSGWVRLSEDKIPDAEQLVTLRYLDRRTAPNGRIIQYRITEDGKSVSGYAYMQE